MPKVTRKSSKVNKQNQNINGELPGQLCQITGSQASYENSQDTQKMLSIFVYLFLPVAGLILLWLRKKLLTQILIHIDELYLPITCSAFGRGRALLEWSKGRLPHQWSSQLSTLSGGLSDFWIDGSLLCTLINTAVPGACPNPYRHWKKPPTHAQDVAYKYFGISSVFSPHDFELPFTATIEHKLLKYLLLIRKCIYKQEQEKLKNNFISSKFVARGMGLFTAEQHMESEFFIYSKDENISFFNIELDIMGPYGSHFRTTVLEYLAKESKIKSEVKIDNLSDSIKVHIELDQNRLKVAYVTEHFGIHQISLSCNRESIMGSPYYINVMSTSIDTKPVNKSSENIKLDKDVSEISYASDNKLQENNSKLNKRTEVTLDNQNEETKDISKNCTTHILKISKYLKDISNSHDKKVNQMKPDKDNVWSRCPDYFTKENYLYFQKLVDSSFRKTCRITRALPKLSQNVCFQFSSASPVCRDHIVPEGCRKLHVDEKRKIFASQKSIPKHFSSENSPFSEQENTKEVSNIKNNINTLEPLNSKINIDKPKLTQPNFNSDATKKTPPQIVQERKTFWETVFKEKDNKTKLNTLPKTTKIVDLKHVDSLNLHCKRPLSKSLNDLHIRDGKLKKYVSIDGNLDICCQISLEARTKMYLDKAHSTVESLRDNEEFSSLPTIINEDRGSFRCRRKNSF